MRWGILIRILCCLGLPLLLLSSVAAYAQQVRVTTLSDVAFGTIANFTSDLINSQSICVYSTGTSGTYHVTATGSGSGGAFTLSSGTNTLAYEVQWSATSGQGTGTSLTAGVALNGLTSTATQQRCTNGPATTASLITILRATAVGAASAGAYSGTLTLLVAPN
jgi:hypothetical protein